MNENYRATVELLLDALPATFHSPNFALKGGTALNLFLLDMPRLSVDIDVAFTNIEASRDDALAEIGASLNAIIGRLETQGLRARRLPSRDATESRIEVQGGRAAVRIEVNTVIRGSVLPPETRSLTPAAEREYRRTVAVPTLARAELYGGKLVAALDRQHPRDLFDVAQLFASGGIDDSIRQCFVIYLASHNRPPHEVLRPSLKDIRRTYENAFRGMTMNDVSLDELIGAREKLLTELPRSLTAQHRSFLRSLNRGEPDWSAAGIPHASRLPALNWKLENIQRLKHANRAKFDEAVHALEACLSED